MRVTVLSIFATGSFAINCHSVSLGGIFVAVLSPALAVNH